jgi:2-methylisocitrate lyase-like PEP mutase family enzyme
MARLPLQVGTNRAREDKKARFAPEKARMGRRIPTGPITGLPGRDGVPPVGAGISEASRQAASYHDAMVTQAEKATQFLALHRGPNPLIMPNPWDAGSARLLASLGFAALATTSGGYAATLGRLDGSVTRDEAIAHATAIVAAVDVPVSADLENCFADAPEGVAITVRLALNAGLAGCSVEDFTGRTEDPIYDAGAAAERVAAAAEVAHGGDVHLVLTARAENYLHGRPDLANTIARLQAYQEAGADVLYAPGLTKLDDIRQVVTSVDRPVNVLALAGVPAVPALAAAGVGRISVGSAFAWTALGAVVEAGRELLDAGTYGFWTQAAKGSQAGRSAFIALDLNQPASPQ